MTEPQPAPENGGDALSAHDPWAPPPPDDGSPASGPPGATRFGPGRRKEASEAGLALLSTAAAGGLLVGLLWYWFAPRIPLVRNGESLYPLNPESEEAIAADGTFLLVSLVVGAVLGILAFLLWRRGGVPLVIGLALGAGLGALLAWRLGIWLEPTRDEVLARGRALEPGQLINAPLLLEAKVAMLGLPFGALAGHATCLAAWGPRDPAPKPRPQPFPQWR